jgi:hypothetical protein
MLASVDGNNRHCTVHGRWSPSHLVRMKTYREGKQTMPRRAFGPVWVSLSDYTILGLAISPLWNHIVFCTLHLVSIQSSHTFRPVDAERSLPLLFEHPHHPQCTPSVKPQLQFQASLDLNGMTLAPITRHSSTFTSFSRNLYMHDSPVYSCQSAGPRNTAMNASLTS